jgi:hypothetical protein
LGIFGRGHDAAGKGHNAMRQYGLFFGPHLAERGFRPSRSVCARLRHFLRSSAAEGHQGQRRNGQPRSGVTHVWFLSLFPMIEHRTVQRLASHIASMSQSARLPRPTIFQNHEPDATEALIDRNACARSALRKARVSLAVVASA